MLNLKRFFVIALFVLCSISVSAQENSAATPTTTSVAAPATVNADAASTKIPANSKIYVNPMEGFETYVVAALQKKKIPVVIVANREQADFEIKGSVEKQKAGWAKTIFISPLPSIDATMQVINIKTGVVAFSNSSTKANARRGRKGSAEHLAKNLARKMKLDGDMKED